MSRAALWLALFLSCVLFVPLEDLYTWLQFLTYDICILNIILLQAYAAIAFVPAKYKYTKCIVYVIFTLSLCRLVYYIYLDLGYTHDIDEIKQWIDYG